MHRHTKHLREPLDSPLGGDSCALHHLGARANWSQSTEISRSLPQAGFRNLKIRNPTRPPKSLWKPDPPPLREDSTGWLAPSPRQSSVCSNPFDLVLPGWCTSRVETLLLQPWLFSPPPSPPPHPRYSPPPPPPFVCRMPGRPRSPGILIHSHCRNGRDVAFRREARPSANPPTRQLVADPGRLAGEGVLMPQARPAKQEGGAAWSGEGPHGPSPTLAPSGAANVPRG